MTPEQFIEKIKARCCEVGECWEWQGSMRGGARSVPECRLPKVYPSKPGTRMRTVPLAVVMWEAAHGREAPAGKLIYRTCGQSMCVYPGHLRSGTRAQMVAAYKKLGTFEHTPARIAKLTASRRRLPDIKLSLDAAREIRAAEGEVTAEALAAQYRVHPSLIHRVWKNEYWKEAANGASVFNWRGAA